jgi:hypothetical protein
MDEPITRRLFLALPAAAILLADCARTPAGLGGSNATQLRFTYTLNGPVNPNYIYVVAIRVLSPAYGGGSSLELTDPTQGPVPVVTTGSKNGVVGGLPTHYVIYTETTPNLYQVYRFPTQTEAPDPTDPDTPINLTWPGRYVGDVIVGSGVDPRPTIAGASYGNQLGFTIDTTYLDQFIPVGAAPVSSNGIVSIQFNILTMNLPATTSGNVSDRVMDAIGNQTNVGNATFSNPVLVDITGQTVTDSTASVMETANDTFPAGSNLPPVDLISPWQLQISTT